MQWIWKGYAKFNPDLLITKKALFQECRLHFLLWLELEVSKLQITSWMNAERFDSVFMDLL